MEILIDTNIALTYLTGREDRFSASVDQIFDWIAEGRISACLAFHSLSTIWYVLRKKYSEEKRREILSALCLAVEVVSAPREEILDALRKSVFRDFEDCLQDKCAKTAGADYIITANIKDFRFSEARALDPDEFVSLMESI